MMPNWPAVEVEVFRLVAHLVETGETGAQLEVDMAQQ